MNTSILSRTSRDTLSPSPEYSALQSQVDGLVGGFVRQATDWRSLAAMTAGGTAYQFARTGLLGAGGGSALRTAASVGLGLTAEVSTFELSHRVLSSIPGGSGPAPLQQNLWRWNGPGGLRQGLLQSFVTFGALRGAGRLARGENLIAQHLFQDSAMVLGHQVSGALGIAPRPEGTLAEQFLHAEATNLQMGAGLALGHRLSPGLFALQRGLEISTPQARRFFLDLPPSSLRPALAGALASEGARPPTESSVGRPDTVYAMEAPPESSGASSAGATRPKRQFWFPTRAYRGGPLHVQYSEMGSALAHLMRELLPPGKIRPERPPESLISLLWVYQISDLARKLSAHMEVHGPERLLEPLTARQEKKESTILDQALELLKQGKGGPESEWVIELHIPYDEVCFGKPGSRGSTHFQYILETIESHLESSVILVGATRDGLRVRFPTPPLFERLLQASSGDLAPRFRYVWGEISRNGAMELKADGEISIGIDRDPILLGDLGVKVHPALFTLHDIFHAASLVVFSHSFRRYTGWLYNLVSNGPIRKSGLTREHLDRIVDMDPPIQERRTYDHFLSHIFGHLGDHYRQEFESGESRYKNILKYRNFIQDYLELLNRNVPDDPQWRVWNQEIQGKLDPILKSLDRVLHSLVQAYFRLPKKK